MALNDPNWGKRGNEGPPDLDELWRRLNQKLGSLFGGKGGGNAPQDERPSDGRRVRTLIVMVLLVWLASGFYIVDEGQRGIVLRFGSFWRPISGPALASALAGRIGRDRQRIRSPHRGSRVPQQRAYQVPTNR